MRNCGINSKSYNQLVFDEYFKLLLVRRIINEYSFFVRYNDNGTCFHKNILFLFYRHLKRNVLSCRNANI